jgi:SAM-dependent MidA family methyltransferase
MCAMSSSEPIASDSSPSNSSGLLLEHLGQVIEQAGGWISFEHFMHLALYEPGLGYYVAGARKFGAGGDFVTAPEISPLFGGCVAKQCAQWLEDVPAQILEFGAGSGALAAQVLNALQRMGRDDVRYSILEVSPDLRARQEQTLRTLVPQALDRVVWLEALPAEIHGIILANEVLDAMPVRLLHFDGAHVVERGVSMGANADLQWAHRPVDFSQIEQLRHMLSRVGWGEPNQWPAPYTFELPDMMSAWVNTVASHLRQGVMLLIDYGFPAAELYHPQRQGGTLMCHARHRAHPDPLILVGQQDITTHVNFTAVAELGLAAGLDLLGYATQANFLLNTGLIEQLSTMAEQAGAVQSLPYMRQAQAVQTLVTETEMGELFKVIALGRGMPDIAMGFLQGDRRHHLGLD